MKTNHDIQTIENIEKELLATGMAICSHDGSKSFWLFPTDRKTTRSRMFIRIYEIYIDPAAKELIKKRDIDTAIGLTFMYQIFVKLAFDYRNNTGTVNVQNGEVKRLCKHYPFMNQYINGGRNATQETAASTQFIQS